MGEQEPIQQSLLQIATFLLQLLERKGNMVISLHVHGPSKAYFYFFPLNPLPHTLRPKQKWHSVGRKKKGKLTVTRKRAQARKIKSIALMLFQCRFLRIIALAYSVLD